MCVCDRERVCVCVRDEKRVGKESLYVYILIREMWHVATHNDQCVLITYDWGIG